MYMSSQWKQCDQWHGYRVQLVRRFLMQISYYSELQKQWDHCNKWLKTNSLMSISAQRAQVQRRARRDVKLKLTAPIERRQVGHVYSNTPRRSIAKDGIWHWQPSHHNENEDCGRIPPIPNGMRQCVHFLFRINLHNGEIIVSQPLNGARRYLIVDILLRMIAAPGYPTAESGSATCFNDRGVIGIDYKPITCPIGCNILCFTFLIRYFIGCCNERIIEFQRTRYFERRTFEDYAYYKFQQCL